MQSASGSRQEDSENRSSWIVLVPAYRYIEPETESGLRELERRGVRVERRHGFSAVDKARAYMATWAYFSGFKRLLWIDSDVTFRAADAEKLLAGNEKFACGVYAVKNDSGQMAARPDQGLAGFGFMLTDSEILTAMAAVLPVCQQTNDSNSQVIPFFLPGIVPHPERERPIYYGEDYCFCYRAAELGFKLHVDFSIRLGHVGPYKYMVKHENNSSVADRSV